MLQRIVTLSETTGTNWEGPLMLTPTLYFDAGHVRRNNGFAGCEFTYQTTLGTTVGEIKSVAPLLEPRHPLMFTAELEWAAYYELGSDDPGWKRAATTVEIDVESFFGFELTKGGVYFSHGGGKRPPVFHIFPSQTMPDPWNSIKRIGQEKTVTT